jgi:hypothetical protein
MWDALPILINQVNKDFIPRALHGLDNVVVVHGPRIVARGDKVYVGGNENAPPSIPLFTAFREIAVNKLLAGYPAAKELNHHPRF